jgi:hypothetical protein
MYINSMKSANHSNKNVGRDQDSLLVIGSFIAVMIFLMILHLGKILTYAFPALSLLTALYLYHRSGLKYVSFCWWIMFLSPEVRRIADFYSVWTNPSPILLAPSLVSCVSIIAIMKCLPRIHTGNGIPFFLCLGSILYGLVVGLLSNPQQDVILALLGWIAPLSTGFYIFFNYTDYPKYKDVILKTFLWGTLVMGIYGVIQYMYVPPWDAFWMDNTRNEVGFNTIGNPIPYEVRVFSTLNSPQPFASVIKAGLFVLFYQVSPLAIVASGFGYLSFFLSSARSAWVSWLFTMLVLLIISRRDSQIRLAINLFFLSVSMAFLTALQPFAENIQGRITSLQEFQSDGSYNVRISVFKSAFDTTIFQGVGSGFGSQDPFSGDHGFLMMLNSLGWIGSLPYLVGIISFFIILFRYIPKVRDRFVGLSTAIALGTFQQMLSNLSVTGSSGAVMWTFLGLAIAGIQYEIRFSSIEEVNSELESA